MKHVRACRDLLGRAFEAANRNGDLTYGAYTCTHLNSNLLFAGEPLPEVQGEAEHGLAYARKARFGLVIDVITTQLAMIRMLRGLTLKFGYFDDGQFNELRIEDHLSSNPALALAACWYWIRKLQALYLAGDYAAARDAASKAQRLLWTSSLYFEEAEYHFYGALAQAAHCDCAPAGERQQCMEALTAHHRQLQVWAENCPENFENRAALVAAEIARIEGRVVDAEQLYEQAIRSARTNGFVHNEGLAYEVAARFYAARGFNEIARLYLGNARYDYLRWGANGKVRQLDQSYPQLTHEPPVAGPTSTIGAPVEHLDLATVIKVSQAVSGEIVLEKLLDTLMRTAMARAGAERVLLILARGATQRIAAEATTSGDAVTVHLRDKSVAETVLPASVLHYVLRTGESVILDDAVSESPFAADRYIQQRQARSILCLPLLAQAKLIGVLYLENSLAPRVFAPSRIAVLKLLASQAAIALENARLYRAEADLREVQMELAHANRVATMGQLTASIAHEVQQPITAVATCAAAGLRWLGARPPNVDEATQALGRIVNDAMRAGDIIGRIRDLVRKAPPRRERVDINEAVREVIELTRGEAAKNDVSVLTVLGDGLPLVQGDRVQLQQVMLNLIVNAIEAMSATSEGPRDLLVSTAADSSEGVSIALSDSGPGLPADGITRVFDPFYTTKASGLGMGLSICHSIIDAYGGRLSAMPNVPRGAVFQFTLPACADNSFGAGVDPEAPPTR
jgi:signal transduction histidine kinase